MKNCACIFVVLVNNATKFLVDSFYKRRLLQRVCCGADPHVAPGDRGSERALTLQSEHGASTEILVIRAEVVAGGLSQRSSLLQLTPS